MLPDQTPTGALRSSWSKGFLAFLAFDFRLPDLCFMPFSSTLEQG
jgi:hypothetical protein